jgi:hypothetical protein
VTESPSTDVHGGQSPTDLRDLYRQVVWELTSSCEHHRLRPSSVNVSTLLGLNAAAVGFTGADTASVDTLGAVYGLALSEEDGNDLYQREGRIDLRLSAQGATVDVYVSVFTRKPTAEVPAAEEAAPEELDGEHEATVTDELPVVTEVDVLPAVPVPAPAQAVPSA